jgi:hypothetical protein
LLNVFAKVANMQQALLPIAFGFLVTVIKKNRAACFLFLLWKIFRFDCKEHCNNRDSDEDASEDNMESIA